MLLLRVDFLPPNDPLLLVCVVRRALAAPLLGRGFALEKVLAFARLMNGVQRPQQFCGALRVLITPVSNRGLLTRPLKEVSLRLQLQAVRTEALTRRTTRTAQQADPLRPPPRNVGGIPLPRGENIPGYSTSCTLKLFRSTA